MADTDRKDDIQGAIVHVYDGIEEADNELPMWWLWIFYGAIVFALGYWFYYEAFGAGPSLAETYAAELEAQAASAPELTEETLAAMAADPQAVAAGAEVFQTSCIACHGAQGEGVIGPNLTDTFFIHGSDPMQIAGVIREGVPAQGMPGWAQVLGADAVGKVTAYVISLRGTNVEGKAPQGTEVELE
ncbi:MAG: c-type cytochrome [Myxococcales bacterium]|nr:c-type cytochrome [Myxococcales bacterium]